MSEYLIELHYHIPSGNIFKKTIMQKGKCRVRGMKSGMHSSMRACFPVWTIALLWNSGSIFLPFPKLIRHTIDCPLIWFFHCWRLSSSSIFRKVRCLFCESVIPQIPRILWTSFWSHISTHTYQYTFAHTPTYTANLKKYPSPSLWMNLTFIFILISSQYLSRLTFYSCGISRHPSTTSFP